ncbi:MAG TPA: hypothetical protein VIS96_00495 [Terrimicrobiaceae bacterium]
MEALLGNGAFLTSGSPGEGQSPWIERVRFATFQARVRVLLELLGLVPVALVFV